MVPSSRPDLTDRADIVYPKISVSCTMYGLTMVSLCRRRFDTVHPVKSSPEILLTLVLFLVVSLCQRFLQQCFKRDHQDSHFIVM